MVELKGRGLLEIDSATSNPAQTEYANPTRAKGRSTRAIAVTAGWKPAAVVGPSDLDRGCVGQDLN
ncbi:MAG: hypothetical protein ACREDF_11255, partial [Thermoplasmata archaeon]